MTESSPFHAGEQQVQERLGVRDTIEPWAKKVVRGHLPDEHRNFYAHLPFIVVAARDESSRPFATLLAGEPGFLGSPDDKTLSISARPAAGDALEGAFASGADIGFLGIDLATRRRNRVNGRVSTPLGDEGFEVAVDQAFGNCPQYIHERDWQRQKPRTELARRTHERFSPALTRWIEGADTFFIATGHRGEGESPTFGMDASHRGGQPGFVRIEDEHQLVFPDYAGNDHYNTIGNLVADPRAGLLFVDFELGDLLQLTGRTRIDWDSEALARFPGARRLVYFELEEAVEIERALPIRWESAGGAVRSLRLVEKTRESDEVISFVFEARDGGSLPKFDAGQHLPIELDGLGQGCGVSRTYSLSNGPKQGRYRISVKRHPQGVASRCLHDRVEVGAILSARAPAGDFVLDYSSPRPFVLISAGIGLTPLLSMLHELVDSGDGRPIWFVHGARDSNRHALRAEARALAERAPNVQLHVAYSAPHLDEEIGNHYDSAGRVDGALLAKLLPDLDCDFYLCGPTPFLASVQEQLEARGVSSERIRYETF
jgi:ferredoxin-NADP reductase/predicted pyridoxine 5'-phosphate oxidase superfamily flavin-nucleotide-binding protein